jgi:predicted small lipoprotein YifL
MRLAHRFVLLACLLVTLSACGRSQPEAPPAPAPPATVALDGGQFNRFFPRSQDGYTIVPAQEKRGFAEYKLNQGGKTLAMLSISDTLGGEAAQKYTGATERVAGRFPTVEQGRTATGALVADRFQVKVLSRDPGFDRADRLQWLGRFDLDGLARRK